MIEVDKLRKEFKKVEKDKGLLGSIKGLLRPKYEIIAAVDNVSFNVPEGEILGFIGPNGAGKSTVIKMMTGILTPTSGKSTINVRDPVADRKKYVKDIGVDMYSFFLCSKDRWINPVMQAFIDVVNARLK